jgi:hypothetical protein
VKRAAAAPNHFFGGYIDADARLGGHRRITLFNRRFLSWHT